MQVRSPRIAAWDIPNRLAVRTDSSTVRSESLNSTFSLDDDMDIALCARWANSPRTASAQLQNLLSGSLPLSPRSQSGMQPATTQCGRVYTAYGPSRCGELLAAEAEDDELLERFTFLAAALRSDEPLTMRSSDFSAHIADNALSAAFGTSAQQPRGRRALARKRRQRWWDGIAQADPAGKLLQWVDSLWC